MYGTSDSEDGYLDPFWSFKCVDKAMDSQVVDRDRYDYLLE